MECQDNVESIIRRENPSPGTQVLTLSRSSYKEYHITSVPEGDEPPEAIFQQAAKALQAKNGRILQLDIFGVKNDDGVGEKAIREAFGEVQCPVTWLIDGDLKELCGVQIWAVSEDRKVETIEMDGRIVGTLYEDDYTRTCRLGDIRPAKGVGTDVEQAEETFVKMLGCLEGVGMNFDNVVRTWFYNRDILAWYGPFNKVRDEFFTKHGVFGKIVPASTGIGGTNPWGTALQAGALAIQGKTEDYKAFLVTSPLQCPALDYGSSFARALEFNTPDQRRILVSGTASIEPGGETVFLDDMDKQTDLTMRVVAAILENRNMSWADVTRGVAYIRNAQDAPAFERYCKANSLPEMPFVVTHNVVCRDDLLFEIEVDAVQKTE